MRDIVTRPIPMFTCPSDPQANEPILEGRDESLSDTRRSVALFLDELAHNESMLGRDFATASRRANTSRRDFRPSSA